MRTVRMMCLLFCIASGVFAQIGESSGSPNVTIGTNLAYLALSAISTSPASAFVIVPVEVQAGIGENFGFNAAVTGIYFSSARAAYAGILLVAECGAAYYPGGNARDGWTVSLSPGVAYAFDAKSAGLVLSADAGYRWLPGRHWMIGLSGGCRYVYMAGSLFIPDVKLRLGWRL